MWNFGKKLLRSYLLLCFVSFIFYGHQNVQRLLVTLWMFDMVRMTHHALQRGHRLYHLIAVVFMSQFPGLIFIGLSSWWMRMGKMVEWPSGMVEIWYHPFIPALELLPSRPLLHWSSMYLETCLVPVAMSIAMVVYWGLLKTFWMKRA